MKIKTIDDALEILNKAREEYGNLPITLGINDGWYTEHMDCLSIDYDENDVEFYNY